MVRLGGVSNYSPFSMLLSRETTLPYKPVPRSWAGTNSGRRRERVGSQYRALPWHYCRSTRGPGLRMPFTWQSSLLTSSIRRCQLMTEHTTTASLASSSRAAPGLYNWQLISLGDGDETSTTLLPSYIELDRLYVHGDPAVGGKRGITMNSRYTTLKNSYLDNFKSTIQDANAIAGWNGPGHSLSRTITSKHRRKISASVVPLLRYPT